MPDADVWLMQNWLPKQQADRLLAYFQEALKWEQVHIKLFGKAVKVPRLQAWYGDAGSSYTYSGLRMVPNEWDTKLYKLKSLCEQTCDTRFNSVLANLYRDGQDSMGLHADNEPELGRQPVIASVSLGELRFFDFKHRLTKEKHRLALQHGSLLLMRGDTQEHWLHGINKTKRQCSPRVNFTFRFVHASSSSSV